MDNPNKELRIEWKECGAYEVIDFETWLCFELQDARITIKKLLSSVVIEEKFTHPESK